MTKKVTPHGSGDFFFCLWALLKSSDRNRQRVFLRARCRSSVNRQWSHFCRQIWATVYYHRTWTSLPFEFSQKKIAWLDLGENETFLSSANSRSKVESLIQRQIKMILQLFQKERDDTTFEIPKKSHFFTTLSESFIFCSKIQLWFRKEKWWFFGWKNRENVVVLDF